MQAARLKIFKERLLARREELQRQSADTADNRKPVEVDQTTQGRLSRMDALQSQAMEIELERRRLNELARIDSALKRIEDKEFGLCVSCGEKIGAKRLEHDPTVAACIHCAKANE